MRRFRPTVFISVPKKWMELQGAVGRLVPLDTASDDEIATAVRHVTSGSLRWGLSAAGHLDSEVFRFFQRYGVELLSGFGMTEATGGITMTPPGGYRDDSLGCALPGIELRLAPDGELLVRGPYVMEGYLEPSGGDPGFDAEDGSTPATSWSRTRTASTAWWTGRRRSTRTSRARPSPPSAWRTSSGTSKRSPACSWSATTASTTRR